MSEAMREPGNIPDGYSPKDKPEILRMAEDAGKTGVEGTPRQVKAAQGGRYIDGIPMLRWGEWRDNSYCGCVTALLNAAGIPASYEEVMGLSGVCYQAIMCGNWDPSSQMPQNGKLCEKNVGDALGVSVYTIGDEKEVWEQAKRSIDGGIPVLMVGGRGEPEWTLACGYAKEDGTTRFFGRTYFDLQSAAVPDSEVYTDNGYFYSSGFPGCAPAALTRFYDRTCEPVPRKQALRVSLEMCIKMFEQPPGEHHRFGYDAYDVLISGFELDDAGYRAKCGCDQYHIGSLQDARRAAYRFLHNSAGLLEGENREKLTQAADIYKTMLTNLQDAVPYERTTAVFNRDSAPVWSAAERQKLVKALRENRTLEKQVRTVIQDILNHWEEK